MFDFDAGKLIVIGIVALIVIGPKDLPRVMCQLGQALSRVRRMASEFQGQFMEAMREADLEEIRADVAKMKDSVNLGVDFNPARDVKEHMIGALTGLDAPKPERSADVGAVHAPHDDGHAGNAFTLDIPPPQVEPVALTSLAEGIAPVTPPEAVPAGRGP